jgi:hypothetical protein
MKNYGFAALLFGLGLLGLGMTVYRQPGLQEAAVINKTKELEVISLLPSGTGYDLLLRNASAKNINGYSLAFKNGPSLTVDLTVGERVIFPGQKFTEHLPSTDRTEPTIRYIVFDDGTGDGDNAAIAELLARRSGRREQLERIVPMLNNAVASGDVELLKMQLQALPDKATASNSLYFAQGMQDAKEDALLAATKLDKGNVRAGLARLVEASSRQMIRLSKRANP